MLKGSVNKEYVFGLRRRIEYTIKYRPDQHDPERFQQPYASHQDHGHQHLYPIRCYVAQQSS